GRERPTPRLFQRGAGAPSAAPTVSAASHTGTASSRIRGGAIRLAGPCASHASRTAAIGGLRGHPHGGHPFATSDFEPETYGAAIVSFVGAFVAGRNGITDDEAQAWVAEQWQARRVGELTSRAPCPASRRRSRGSTPKARPAH
ncbi:MAG: hypothetical protein M3456_15450, partial [Actinomycetota bacterium]|nr:hypothetical protein [Actinomycetota bacterium]